MLLANVFLLAVGCFMETIAAITILVPVFMPIDRLPSRRQLPDIVAYQGGLTPCAPSGSIWV